MLERYSKNSLMIKKALDSVLNYVGLDSYEDLPIVYQKAEDQLANIDIYINSIDNDIDDMTLKKEIIQQKIKLLSKKKEVNLKDKDTFVDNKTKSIQRLTEEITNIKKDIEHKRNLFKLLQPTTDEYLLKLNDT